jgi:hypothetical protein
MIDWSELRELTMGYRNAVARLVREDAARADVIPPLWRNNLRWHVGHLAVTPRGLTRSLLGEPTGVSDDYRNWFKKGSSPADWAGAELPPVEAVVQDMLTVIPTLFDELEDRANEPYPVPYPTSVGVTLHTPREALAFSLGHDGLHLGLVMALKRSLNGM